LFSLQIALVPTLALLLGLPIPFSNLGAIIPELFFDAYDDNNDAAPSACDDDDDGARPRATATCGVGAGRRGDPLGRLGAGVGATAGAALTQALMLNAVQVTRASW